MQYNNKLLKLLDLNDLDFFRKDLKYWQEDRLQISAELIFPKIVEYKSGYYLDNPVFKKNLKDHGLNYSDIAEGEWEINEIYLLDNSNDYKILIWKTLKIIKSIKTVLQENFQNKEFIIVGILNNYDTQPSISIRFYCNRANEPDMLDIHNLDSYQEAIIVDKVNPIKI
jgi:hypothetical protein